MPAQTQTTAPSCPPSQSSKVENLNGEVSCRPTPVSTFYPAAEPKRDAPIILLLPGAETNKVLEPLAKQLQSEGFSVGLYQNRVFNGTVRSREETIRASSREAMREELKQFIGMVRTSAKIPPAENMNVYVAGHSFGAILAAEFLSDSKFTQESKVQVKGSHFLNPSFDTTVGILRTIDTLYALTPDTSAGMICRSYAAVQYPDVRMNDWYRDLEKKKPDSSAVRSGAELPVSLRGEAACGVQELTVSARGRLASISFPITVIDGEVDALTHTPRSVQNLRRADGSPAVKYEVLKDAGHFSTLGETLGSIARAIVASVTK